MANTTLTNPAAALGEAARFGEIRGRLFFLIGGMVVYLFSWAAAVAVWRRVLGAQAVAAIERARERGTLPKSDAE